MSRDHHPAKPLARRHMPAGFDISIERYTSGRRVRIPDDYGPAQGMRGFDGYRNIIDYIVRITHRIWESADNAGAPREVEYIDACYAPNSKVYDDYGLQRGSRKIIGDTHHTTGAFPDIVLDAEEVIWAGDDAVGFHTSHLTRIKGTNTSPSRYGPATGARVSFLVIANCVALENDIFLEHVLYNTSAMLKQLGLDLWQEAARLAADPPPGWPRDQLVWNELRSAAAPARPLSQAEPVDSFDPDALARSIHDNIWNGDGAAIAEHYDADMRFEGVTDREFVGTDAYRGYVDELRTAFPDLTLQTDETYWMGNDTDGWLVSTRWSADGTHSGATIYGEPTGKRCQIWGITQWRIRDGRVVREWQLFNEFDLMMQIARARNE
ncbi:MAG: ester cyclase [Boseongicola sp. SB0673_bin_14]|nr:ester cyclase [Boseongicola sp. SB0667_bin_21]MYI69551.1 ester cyclase [Boseongicola sp. SB0673_bin_14]